MKQNMKRVFKTHCQMAFSYEALQVQVLSLRPIKRACQRRLFYIFPLRVKGISEIYFHSPNAPFPPKNTFFSPLYETEM